VVPELERLRPGAAVRAGRAAVVVRGAAMVVAGRAAELLSGERTTWPRAELRGEPEVVLGEVVRQAAVRVVGGRGRDRMSSSVLSRIARAVRDRETDPRKFRAGGLEVEVTARAVTIRRIHG